MERVGFQPKLARQADGLETGFRPPVRFPTGAVQFAMVCPAQRDGKLVADLEAETAGLRKLQMMGIAGLASATRQGCLATNRRWVLSRRRRATGIASTLLSMRERISWFAPGWSGSAGEMTSPGIVCRRPSRA